MEQKLAQLTETIYKEGVQKGEAEGVKITDEAKKQAASIIDDAKKEAEKMLADAKKQAEELKRNVNGEIKLSGQQAVNSVKQQITEVVVAKLINESATAALDNPEVVKDMITTVVGNWHAGAEALSLEVLLPANKQEDLEKALTAGLGKLLKGGLSLSFTKAVKGGFQIGPQDGSYKISLTDDDFKEFFKEFIRPRTRTLLFGE